MEAPHEVAQVVGSVKDQQNHVMVKGKRTKRQRPQSPIPFTLATNSSPLRDAGDDRYTNGENNNMNNDDHDNTNFSSATLAGFYQDSTEEEEDMANCLILLAQGQNFKELQYQPLKKLDEDAKFTSRRYLEAATGTSGGKAGYYVYECKTCSRTFPSFQALGGHRASHKKPKNIAAEERRQSIMLSSSDDEEAINLPSLSLQFSNRGLYSSNTNNKNSKSHECSICGAEFNSGQALGGHMRRHRGPVTANTSTVSYLISTASDSDDLQAPEKSKNVASLDLDLNLPAPADYHLHRDSNVPLTSTQQREREQQRQHQQHVFSSPNLVDCHY